MTFHFERLTENTWVAQSSVFATNSGLLIHEGDACLIDPGVTPAELEATRAFLEMHGAYARIIILTHAHWDHLLGPASFPEAKVIVHRRYLDVARAHAQDLQRQVARWRMEEGLTTMASFVPPKPNLAFESHLALRLGAFTLHLLAAPGHAPDQIVVHEPKAGLLWAGDMLSDIEVPMPMDAVASYLRTLTVVASLKLKVLIPGHGTPTDDPQEIHTRLHQDRAYLESLRDCVADALRHGADLAGTLAACRGLRFAQPDSYPNAHTWNIEQTYLELGGAVTTDDPVGWSQDWV